MAYFVEFNETDLYVDETVDRFDVNKLFGFSNGMHHNNSYRFGWNCLDNVIHIYAYTYVNKVRVITEIGTVKLNEHYKFIINIKKGKCVYTVIDSDYNIQQNILQVPNKKIRGYSLWPYFGGNKTAPKEIQFDMEKIDD
jgi:hypothetical protein